MHTYCIIFLKWKADIAIYNKYLQLIKNKNAKPLVKNAQDLNETKLSNSIHMNGQAKFRNAPILSKRIS